MSKKEVDNKIPRNFKMKLGKKLNLDDFNGVTLKELSSKMEKTIDDAENQKLKNSFQNKRKMKAHRSLQKAVDISKNRDNAKNTPTFDALTVSATTNDKKKRTKSSIGKEETTTNELTPRSSKTHESESTWKELDKINKKYQTDQNPIKKTKIQKYKIIEKKFKDKVQRCVKKEFTTNENVEIETMNKPKMPHFPQISPLFKTTTTTTINDNAYALTEIKKRKITTENKIDSRSGCETAANEKFSKWRNFFKNINKNDTNQNQQNKNLEQKFEERTCKQINESQIANSKTKAEKMFELQKSTYFPTKNNNNNNEHSQFSIKKDAIFKAKSSKPNKIYESKLNSRLNRYREVTTNENTNNQWLNFNNNATTTTTTTSTTAQKAFNSSEFKNSLFEGINKNLQSKYSFNCNITAQNNNFFINLVSYTNANQRLQNLRSKLFNTAVENKNNDAEFQHFNISDSAEQKTSNDESMDWEPIQQDVVIFKNNSDKIENATTEKMSISKDLYQHPLFNDINENIKTILNDKCVKTKYETDFLYFVLDTNVLLQNLPFIKDLITMKFNDIKGTICFVPYIVIMELDKIKDKHDRPVNLRRSAKTAIQYINAMVESNIGSVQVQSALKDCVHIIDVNSPDDKIINCCLQLKQKNIDKIILLTEDVNLRNKASGCKINATTINNLIKNEMVI